MQSSAHGTVRFQLLAYLLASLCLAPALGASRSELPNIVIIFTDDQGYADVGVFGAKGFVTPNLDRLASQGRIFRNFHVVQPVCSASRCGLLTGCYPNRLGIHGALGPRSKVGISANEMTLADLVKKRGYSTAIFGKWHLGDSPQFLPLRHGFDEYFGLPYSNDMWPLHPDLVKLPPDAEKRKRGYPDLRMFENNKVVIPNVNHEDQNQLTTWYTEHAIKFIDAHKAVPFLLYLAHNMPHVPLHVSDKFRGKSERGLYGDVIEEIDWSVGQVMDALKRNGLEENTWVIFTSDNGPWLCYGDHAGSAYPLREGKGTNWEGGTREPCIMRWPGKIQAGTESMASTFGQSFPDRLENQEIRTTHTGSITKSTSSRRSSVAMAVGNSNFPTPFAPSAANPAAMGARPLPTNNAKSKNPNCTISSTTSAKTPTSPPSILTLSNALKPKPKMPALNLVTRSPNGSVQGSASPAAPR